MRNAKTLTAVVLGIALLLASCSSTVGPSDPQDEGVIPTRTLHGTVELPEGSRVDLAEFTILSFAEGATLASDGTFTVLIPDTDSHQVLIVVDPGGIPLVLAYVGSTDEGITVDATSTATALAMLNPFTVLFSAGDRASLAGSMMETNDWDRLVTSIETVLANTSDGSLTSELVPEIVQAACGIVVDVLDDGPVNPLPLSDPWLEDVAGGSVSWVNRDPVYYTSVFKTVGSTDSLLVLVDSAREKVRISAGWPPLVDVSSVTRSSPDLGDGAYDVTLTHASFRSFETQTAEGLATVMNTCRAIAEMVAVGSGVVVEHEPAGLDLSGWDNRLGSSAAAHDTYGFIGVLLDNISQDSDAVASWFWEGANADCADYMEALSLLMSGISFSTEVIAAGESRVPLVSRMVTQSPQEQQRITQLDGVMSHVDSHSPPTAVFTVNPPFATAGSTFSFSALASTDPDDETIDLEVRWDWDNDGEWDTDWDTQKVMQHVFVEAGAQSIAMQVKDPLSLNDTIVHTVNVGGSQDNAVHIIIFRDAIPWGPEVPAVLDQMLEIMEFTEGTGANEYEILGSSEMATATLTPGEDLVIIQNDQPQAFYDEYADNQVRFLQFVSGGGTIFWEACDLGWNGGSITSAGIVLPGALELTEYETWYNYVSLPGAPIVEGLPEELYGQYASHEGISNLPDGATVYTVDDAGHPTLVEYDYRGGWVIVTTQPLEHSFYNNWTSGHVMPRVVSYVLGVPLIHDFGDIIKPELRGRPRSSGGDKGLTSGKH
ncbi:PKD domain-containing protein [bacterium]|nr:PKD domain-containing protein [bacterium]